MEEFDFDFHRFRTTYPQTGTRVQLGNSYVFTAPPTGPVQRKFVLHFAAMKYYLNESGVLDETIEPKTNMLRFIRFYERHLLHKSFLYNHPVHGQLVVRFADPLDEPEGIPNGGGAVEGFQVTLLEQP